MIGPLSYIGGKNRLASRLIQLFPEHQTYVEPFCGGAQVFFRKGLAPAEILNDLNEDIFNFLRICQLHHEELIRYLKYAVVSRRWFDLFEKTPPETLTDIQRAARFSFCKKTVMEDWSDGAISVSRCRTTPITTRKLSPNSLAASMNGFSMSSLSVFRIRTL
jgi:site-specific DNA-adenine methylase